jgi:hypothetical protein
MAAPSGRHLRAFVVSSFPIRRPGARPDGSTLARHEVDRRVFASSIDFDVEFHLIAFVQARQAGPLNRADVHERIGLTIITGDEAETLHAVEELDRAGRAVTGQLTLRCFTLGDCDYLADNLQIACRNLAAPIHQGEFKLLTFSEGFKARALYGADVNEYVLAAFIALDEAEALGRVEEFYSALGLPDDLCRHSATTAAAAASTATAEAITASAAATEAITAAATAEAIAASAAAAEAITTAAEAIAAAAATESILTSKEGIESFLSKPIPLVASPTATTSVKTHLYERTFASPQKSSAHSRGRVALGIRASSRTHSTALSCKVFYTQVSVPWRT